MMMVIYGYDLEALKQKMVLGLLHFSPLDPEESCRLHFMLSTFLGNITLINSKAKKLD